MADQRGLRSHAVESSSDRCCTAVDGAYDGRGCDSRFWMVNVWLRVYCVVPSPSISAAAVLAEFAIRFMQPPHHQRDINNIANSMHWTISRETNTELATGIILIYLPNY